jgi:hypothetical protein
MRGLGITQAQSDAITNAAMAFNDAQIADAQAGLTSWSPTTLAAQQNLQAVAAASSVASAVPPATAYVPYVLAGAVGVAILAAIVYYTTE